jgi:hypothetical protein
MPRIKTSLYVILGILPAIVRVSRLDLLAGITRYQADSSSIAAIECASTFIYPVITVAGIVM